LPWRPMQKPLAWLISTFRAKKSRAGYQKIGGGSPLRKLTEEQAQALAENLKQRGHDVKVYVGMRYWHPFNSEAVEQILSDGINRLIVLPLYPQFSISTTGSSTKDLYRILQTKGGARHLRRSYITRWFDHPLYIQALAEMIREEMAKFPDEDPSRIHLLYSAHSVPQSYIEEGDPYLKHTQKTVELVNEALGNRSPWTLAFQSKVGPVRWLEPSTEEALHRLAKEGARQVLAIPISFVSEHIETLYEIDIEYSEIAEEAGVPYFRRAPALNSHPTFIQALTELVAQKLDQNPHYYS